TPEVAFHRLDADRPQTGAPTLQRPYCAIIDHQSPPGLQMAGQPLLACSPDAFLGQQQGSQLLARREPVDHPLDAATNRDGARAGTSRQASSAQLGLHAAAPERTG